MGVCVVEVSGTLRSCWYGGELDVMSLPPVHDWGRLNDLSTELCLPIIIVHVPSVTNCFTFTHTHTTHTHTQDDEGRSVAIKIDRLDSKKCTPDTATKAYIEVRAEVSILQNLHHPHIIDFIGVVLQPLCFILEWAPGGSLSSVLQKYRKLDARIGPLILQHTAHQV